MASNTIVLYLKLQYDVIVWINQNVLKDINLPWVKMWHNYFYIEDFSEFNVQNSQIVCHYLRGEQKIDL